MASIKELRQKAISNPSSVTDEEKLQILDWPSRDVIAANVSRVTEGEYTPEQLLHKAATTPDLLTMWECKILQEGFHYHADHHGGRPRRMQLFRMPKEELSLHVSAKAAVLRPEEKLAFENARTIFSRKVADAEVSPKWIARMDVLSKPPAWVRQSQDSRLPWGYAMLKSADAKAVDQSVWDNFMYFCDHMISSSLGSVKGGLEISGLKVLQLVDTEYEEDAHEAIRERFLSLKASGELQQGVLQNTVIFITAASMNLPAIPNLEQLLPWAWVFDPSWTPNSKSSNLSPDTQQDDTEAYKGRLKVSWNSLYTWFYAERLQGSKTMEELWKESLLCEQKVWDTFAGNGIEPYPVPVTAARKEVDQYTTLRERYD